MSLAFGYGWSRSSARIISSLNPGTHWLQVRAFGARTGAYVLRTNFAEASQVNCPVRDLVPGAALNETLASTDCRVLDIRVPSTDASQVDQYRLSVAQRGVLTAEMSSSAFDSALPLFDSEFRSIDSDSARQRADAKIGVTLDPAVKDIAANDLVRGAFAGGDCRVKDILPNRRDYAYANQYRLSVSQRGILVVDLTSAEFDPSISIYLAGFVSLGQSPFSSIAGTARITASLAPGTYTILATSRGVGAGAYTLKTSFQEMLQPPCPVTDVNPEGALTGALSAKDCRQLDLVAPSTDSSYVDQYRVDLLSRGILTVDLISADFTAYVRLYDLEYRSITFARGASAAARLTASLKPGTYIIVAASQGVAAGPYQLKTSFTEAVLAACPAEELALDGVVEGALSDGDCRLMQLVAPSTSVSYVKVYRLTVVEAGALAVELVSSEFRASLILCSSQCELSAQQDSAVAGKTRAW